MRVLLVGVDANDQNLLQKGRPFIMRLPGLRIGFDFVDSPSAANLRCAPNSGLLIIDWPNNFAPAV
jgi:hypothetical protein